MNLQNTITNAVKDAVSKLYSASLETVEIQETRKEFDGELTVVVFPMLRIVKGNPVAIGEAIGNYLVAEVAEVTAFNVVKGFLNLVIADAHYLQFFDSINEQENFGIVQPQSGAKAIMVEYSSPNTNKPLHLGHIRNNLLGYSVAEIIKASGKKVYKTQIINDRGIHICKSMLAWQKFGNNETPDSTGLKGDKLVGNYYVAFDKAYKKGLNDIFEAYSKEFYEYCVKAKKTQILPSVKSTNHQNLILVLEALDNAIEKYLIKFLKKQSDIDYLKKHRSYISDFSLSGKSEIEISIKECKEFFRETLKKYGLGRNIDELKFEDKKEKEIVTIYNTEVEKIVPIMKEAQEMLRKWESGDTEVVALWKKMNQWVYDGFATTYTNLGVNFDSYYYESDTYLLGKDVVADGLAKGIFYRKEDGSVWIDLTEEGLDEKIVLRSDGTAVYMTQDIGTAIQRVKDYPDVGGMIYTVGNEQDYHFQVLFLILKKLGYDWAENLYHLSYGMVDLPSGKMKSREGTVVDADDLIADMANTAEKLSEELGKLDGYTDAQKKEIYKIIGLGALKYYILKVDPKKRILFNPEESVDFQGNTGPFIQYTYARIQAILRKATAEQLATKQTGITSLDPKEKELLKQLAAFPEVIQQAAHNHSPALIANYTYDLVKSYNSFFQNVSIYGADTPEESTFRIQLSRKVGQVIKLAFGLLGIAVPERM